MDEMREIEDFMKQLDPNIDVIWGTSTDNSLGKDVKVIILAAAMTHEMQAENASSIHQPKDDAYYSKLMQQLYAAPKANVRTVVQGELPFVEDEATDNDLTETDNLESAESGISAEGGSEPIDPDILSPDNQPKPTFLQKAIKWLMTLTDE